MKGVLIVLLSVLLIGCAQNVTIDTPQINEGDNMQLTSSAFKHKEMVPRKFTCQGEDVNPDLSWADVPEGTKSFALIMDDPDAPVGTWIHWLVKDIPSDITSIAENSVLGKEVSNSFGRPGWGGPCPPTGVHRYFFKLYALDVETLDADNSDDFYKQVEEHKIEEAVLMGNYEKS